jgi:S-disulfanyl-L-cysteine oxidoreductase SoxD
MDHPSMPLDTPAAQCSGASRRIRVDIGLSLAAILAVAVELISVTPSVAKVSTSAHAANVSDGWYTPDQAAHGHVTFNSFCAECHRPDLRGAMGPALVGDAFLQTWANRPLGDLFTFVHTKMPANNPGSVPEDKLWIITAYILQKNGFPSGNTPLGAQAEGRVLIPPSGSQVASRTAAPSK